MVRSHLVDSESQVFRRFEFQGGASVVQEALVCDVDAVGGVAAAVVLVAAVVAAAADTGCYEGEDGTILGVPGVYRVCGEKVLACFVLHGGPCMSHMINNTNKRQSYTIKNIYQIFPSPVHS